MKSRNVITFQQVQNHCVCGITNTINYNFGNIKTDSYNSLLIKKILTFHNIIILVKSK